jgi:hypothetical protein
MCMMPTLPLDTYGVNVERHLQALPTPKFDLIPQGGGPPIIRPILVVPRVDEETGICPLHLLADTPSEEIAGDHKELSAVLNRNREAAHLHPICM